MADSQNPTAPKDLAFEFVSGNMNLTWSPSTDNVGVTGYEIFRTGTSHTTVSNTVYSQPISNLPAGSSWWQVRAFDAANNHSVKTVPVMVYNPYGNWDPLRVRDGAGAVLPHHDFGDDPTGTIIVDDDGGAGVDYTSISTAIANAGPNDVIEVRDGTYRETLGEWNKKVTIQAAHGHHPLILGTEPMSTPSGGNIRTFFAPWRNDPYPGNPLLSLDGDQLDEDPATNPFYGGLVYLGDDNNSADLLPEQIFWVDDAGDWHEFTQKRKGKTLNNGEFSYDPDDREFTVNFNNWGDVESLEVTTRREGIRLYGGADHSTLRGLEFRAFSPRTDSDGFATVAVNNSTVGGEPWYVTIEDVAVTHSGANGFAFSRTKFLTLSHITADSNVLRGVSSTWSRSLTIEFSRFTNNNKLGLRDHNSILAGVKIAGNDGGPTGDGNDPDGSLIRYNNFSYNDATGYWCDLWCENDIIVGNYASTNDGHGIYYEVSEDAVIASNLLINNNWSGIKVGGSQHVDIVRNTFIGNTDHIRLGTDTRSRAGGGDANRRPGFPTITDTEDVDIRGNVFAEPNNNPRTIVDAEFGLNGPTLDEPEIHYPSDRLGVYVGNVHAVNNFNGTARYIWDMENNWQTPSGFTLNEGGGGSNQATDWNAGDPYTNFVYASGGDWRLKSTSASGELSDHTHQQTIPSSVTAHMEGAGTTSSPAGAVFS